jgi:hypothetical protein
MTDSQTLESIMTMADVITAFAAAIAAMSFVYGVSAWKREFVGKRRIELAETVLAKFYEAADVIREVRSPHGWSGQGKDRQREKNDKPDESRALDQANVLFERWNKHRDLFAELQSLKFRCMATFGKTAYGPFKDLVDIRNDMVIAANELGSHLWPQEMRGEMSERKAADKRKYEDVIWRPLDQKEDAIALRVNKAVEKVENLLQDELRSQRGWRRRAWQWCKCQLQRRGRQVGTTPETDSRLAATSAPT